MTVELKVFQEHIRSSLVKQKAVAEYARDEEQGDNQEQLAMVGVYLELAIKALDELK